MTRRNQKSEIKEEHSRLRQQPQSLNELDSVSVSSGRHHRIPRKGGFSTQTLTVLEAGKPKIMLLADSVHGEDSSWPVDGRFLAVVSGGFSVCTLGRSGC